MTTELEKQFFDTFGIETKEKSYCWTTYCTRKPSIKFSDCEICRNCKNSRFYTVPEITDKQYLELICILGYFEIIYKPDNCEELKKYILKYYLNLDDSEIRELKHQVQAIFEGER